MRRTYRRRPADDEVFVLTPPDWEGPAVFDPTLTTAGVAMVIRAMDGDRASSSGLDEHRTEPGSPHEAARRVRPPRSAA